MASPGDGHSLKSDARDRKPPFEHIFINMSFPLLRQTSSASPAPFLVPRIYALTGVLVVARGLLSH